MDELVIVFEGLFLSCFMLDLGKNKGGEGGCLGGGRGSMFTEDCGIVCNARARYGELYLLSMCVMEEWEKGLTRGVVSRGPMTKP